MTRSFENVCEIIKSVTTSKVSRVVYKEEKCPKRALSDLEMAKLEEIFKLLPDHVSSLPNTRRFENVCAIILL